MKANLCNGVEEYELKIKGEVTIKIDDRIVAECENKWTKYFMASLVETVGWMGRPAQESYAYTIRSPTARVGTDTTTTTSVDMTDLAQKIDIAPSSVTRKWIRDTDKWRWIAQFEFIWNPNVLPSTTIGEAGVWFESSSGDWSSPYNRGTGYVHIASFLYNAALRLCVRVSVADGDFSPIDYVYTQTLSFVWRLIIQP